MATEQITRNPFKRGSAASRFFDLCGSVPNGYDPKDGHSRIVEIDELEQHDLALGNGGSWCRDDGALAKRFNVHRKIHRGRIVSVQLTGYKVNHFDNRIDPRITAGFKGERCRVLATGKGVEVDHKDGRKIDYKLHANQSLDNFQPLSKPANDAKRTHCKACAATGRRFDARVLGYSVPQMKGPEEYVGSCDGCYWHDPRAFNGAVSKQFVKDR